MPTARISPSSKSPWCTTTQETKRHSPGDQQTPTAPPTRRGISCRDYSIKCWFTDLERLRYAFTHYEVAKKSSLRPRYRHCAHSTVASDTAERPIIFGRCEYSFW